MVDTKSLRKSIRKNKVILVIAFSIFMMLNTILLYCCIVIFTNTNASLLVTSTFSVSGLLVSFILSLFLTLKTVLSLKSHSELEDLVSEFDNVNISDKFVITIKLLSRLQFSFPNFRKHIDKEGH